MKRSELKKLSKEDGIERCQNPFRKKTCGRTDIVLLINYDGKDIPICSLCWKNISVGDNEWGTDPKPTFEEVMGDRAKEEAAATLTEYTGPKHKKVIEEEVEETEEF